MSFKRNHIFGTAMKPSWKYIYSSHYVKFHRNTRFLALNCTSINPQCYFYHTVHGTCIIIQIMRHIKKFCIKKNCFVIISLYQQNKITRSEVINNFWDLCMIFLHQKWIQETTFTIGEQQGFQNKHRQLHNSKLR